MKISTVLALALFCLALAPLAGKADDDQAGPQSLHERCADRLRAIHPGSRAHRELSHVQPQRESRSRAASCSSHAALTRRTPPET